MAARFIVFLASVSFIRPLAVSRTFSNAPTVAVLQSDPKYPKWFNYLVTPIKAAGYGRIHFFGKKPPRK
jgi:hypothetical protein